MLSRLRRQPSDGGAVAILVVLLVLLVALPAAAVGLSAAVRNGTRVELQQAADAAALAGAASIPLASTSELVGFLRGDALQAPAAQSLQRACDQAVLSARTDAALTRPGGFASAAGGSGCGVAGSGALSPGFVSASFLDDSTVFEQTGDCLEFIGDNFAGPVPDEPTQPLFYGLAGAVRGLGSVLPLLVRRGVEVRTRASVSTPLDGLGPFTAGAEQEVRARAVRRVKNLVVLPVVGVAGTRVSLTPTVGGITNGTVPQALDAVQDQLGSPVDDLLPPGVEVPDTGLDLIDDNLDDLTAFTLPRSCTSVISALKDDYQDVVDPRDNPRTQTEIIEDALAADEGLKVILLGPDATVLDTLDVCFGDVDLRDPLEPVYTVLGRDGVRCTTEAPGSLRATLVR